MAILGIDLGTSNSAAAVLRGGRPGKVLREAGAVIHAQRPDAGGAFRETRMPPEARVVDADYRETR
jgi:molecular chaperone DnaK (HSP70)